jgi:hypothetical protein
MGVHIVMDRNGDTRHAFDLSDATAIALAEERFKHLTGRGFRAVALIDWIGECGSLRIISAPSGHGGDGRQANQLPYPRTGGRLRGDALLVSARTHRDPGKRATVCQRFSNRDTALDPPSRSASQRLEGCCAQKVSRAIVIGTPMKAPNVPHRNVQRNTEKSTTKGEIASTLPETRGSI